MSEFLECSGASAWALFITTFRVHYWIIWMNSISRASENEKHFDKAHVVDKCVNIGNGQEKNCNQALKVKIKVNDELINLVKTYYENNWRNRRQTFNVDQRDDSWKNGKGSNVDADVDDCHHRDANTDVKEQRQTVLLVEFVLEIVFARRNVIAQASLNDDDLSMILVLEISLRCLKSVR